MENKFKFAALLLTAAALTSCANRELLGDPDYQLQSDRKEAFTQAWVKHFGPIDPKQDWYMLTGVEAKIDTKAYGNAAKTLIYTASPEEGGWVTGMADRDGSLIINTAKTTESLYAKILDSDGNTLSEGYYPVVDGKMTVDGTSAVPAKMSRYAHPTSYFSCMLVCEDLGSVGDFDFNDVVIGVRILSRYDYSLLSLYPMAAGGTLRATLDVTDVLNKDDDENYIEVPMKEIHDWLKPGSSSKEFINTADGFTVPGRPYVFKVPYSYFMAAWQNLKLRVDNPNGPTIEITTPTEGSAPQILCIAGDWFWPKEYMAIDAAYPGFKKWSQTYGFYGDDQIINSLTDINNVVQWDIDDIKLNYFTGISSDGGKYVDSSSAIFDSTVPSGSTCYLEPQIYLNGLFGGKSKLETLDIDAEHFDTQFATRMDCMFSGCKLLDGLDIKGWDVSRVENFNNMFNQCESLSRNNINSTDAVFDLSGWNTVSGTDFRWMFAECHSMDKLAISNWAMTNATDLSYMFSGYGSSVGYGIREINMSGWTPMEQPNVSMYHCFHRCRNLEKVDFTGWGANKVTKNVENMEYMFEYCTSLQSLDLHDWDMSSIKTMEYMFYHCESLESINLTGWTKTMPALEKINRMFEYCTNIEHLDVSGWNMPNLTDMSQMFRHCTSLESIDLHGWNIGNVTSFSQLFEYCTNLESADLHDIDVSHVTDMGQMFESCENLRSLDLRGWHLPSGSLSLNSMFSSVNPDLVITCSAETRQRLLDNGAFWSHQPLYDPNCENWHIVED